MVDDILVVEVVEVVECVVEVVEVVECVVEVVEVVECVVEVVEVVECVVEVVPANQLTEKLVPSVESEDGRASVSSGTATHHRYHLDRGTKRTNLPRHSVDSSIICGSDARIIRAIIDCSKVRKR